MREMPDLPALPPSAAATSASSSDPDYELDSDDDDVDEVIQVDPRPDAVPAPEISSAPSSPSAPPPPPPPPLPAPPAQAPQLASPTLLRQLFPNLYVGSEGSASPRKPGLTCCNTDVVVPLPSSGKHSPVPSALDSETLRTYAEVVKSPPVPAAAVFNADIDPSMKPIQPRLKSFISVPVRSNFFAGREPSPDRQVYCHPTEARRQSRHMVSSRNDPILHAHHEQAFLARNQERKTQSGCSASPSPRHRRNRHSRLQGRSSSRRPFSAFGPPHHQYVSPGLRAFREKINGRCFVCLSRNHRAATCREQFRCFTCLRSGHRSRECGWNDTTSLSSRSRDASQGCPRAPKVQQPLQPPSELLKSKELFSLQNFFAEQATILCNEVHQIVASATLPLHSRLNELQEKIHDWIRNTKEYVIGRELQPGQHEVPDTHGAFPECELIAQQHNVVSSGKTAPALIVQPPSVPVHRVYNRLLQDMPSVNTNFSARPVSHQDVEDALHRLQMATDGYPNGDVDNMLPFSSEGPAAIKDLHASYNEEDDTGRLMLHTNIELVGNSLHDEANSGTVVTTLIEHNEQVPINMPKLAVHTATSSATITAMDNEAFPPTDQSTSPRMGVASLFTTPPKAVLQSPAPQRDPAPAPAPRRRRQRTFDMSSVRRSVRLSTARPMTQMQRAQRNLCRKLGIMTDDAAPIEAALQEFLGTFNGPLPVDVDAALNEMFNLNDEEIEAMNHSLIGMVGEGVDGLPEAAVPEHV